MKRHHFIRYYLVLAVITALLCVLGSPVLAKLPASPAAPTSLQQEGKVLYDNGRYAETVQVLQQEALQYRSQGDNLRLAATLSNLCLAYQQLGAWNDAKQAIAESLNILGYPQQQIRGQAHPKLKVLAQSLDILGRLQLVTGQPQEASVTWQDAQKVYSNIDDKNGVVRSRINQAEALRTQGFYRRAEKTLEDVSKILQSQPDSLEKTVGLRSLGDVLQVVGKLKDSQDALQQSLEIAQRLKSPAQIGASLFSLGNNATTQQQTQQAIEFYQKTVQVSPSPLTKVQAQLNQLTLLIENQQLAQAQTLIPLIQPQLDTLPLTRSAIYARINFAHSLGKLTLSGVEALGEQTLTPSFSTQLLTTAVQQARDLGDKQSEAYALGSLGGLYEKAGEWSEAQNLTQQALLLAQASHAPEIAYRWQWQLGRLLKAKGDIKKAIAAYDTAVDTLQSLRSDLAAVTQDVQFSFRDSVEPVYRQSVELLLKEQQTQPNNKNLEKARQQIEALQLAELDNFFRQACLLGQKVLLDKVVDRDNPTAAILYPIILEDELQVIVKIPKQPLQHYSTKISQAEVEKIVGELRQNLVQPYAIKAFKTQSQQVYNWLIKPIESQLQKSGVNTLVFIPDGVLRNIPLSALYDGKQYLVEKYAIALSIGLQLQNPKPLARGRLNALTAGLTQPPLGYSQFSPLPAIKTELNLIAQAGISTTSLLDQQFTKQAWMSKVNATRFNILHLATHGQFSSRADQTFILAANGPINVIDFDNILRTRDEKKPEGVQLLVLSACQTAAGDNRAALGLAGAAFKAGARSTVASLWQIDDESTAQFVGAFYTQLKNVNMTKAEALRLAQLQLLKHPNYSSPSFWSAYVLIGNWL
ncbi:CHAT domain-containing protein [Brasilonema octagenarum]|uniref:CHAT domain-containing protein n=1 Tax=Brasilonema octagenarum TaxID=417105 RepID=UPI00145C530B|nr:CHAT domain-containing protein [Brasilonema octagenarum]